jgi:hypothetical protein
MNKIENEFKLEYIIEYDKPIVVSEFTNALNAISNQYKNFYMTNIVLKRQKQNYTFKK